MLCDICGKNTATVHLTEIIDNQMNELHLCEDCARQKSAEMEQQFGLSDLLAGLAEFEKPVKEAEAAVSVKCKRCGLSYADFKKVGRLGCGECYNAFKKYLSVLLKRIHGSNRHMGKSPVKVAKLSEKKLDLQELRQQLQRAIEQEEFEEAARLRDMIRDLEKKNERNETK
jgi:protein arginine kinase activator